MQKVALLIGRRKRGLRSFSSRLDSASFLGDAGSEPAGEGKNRARTDITSSRATDERAVGIGLVATGLMYNSKVFAEKGWAPPTSWNDLKDPKYQKQLVIPPI